MTELKVGDVFTVLKDTLDFEEGRSYVIKDFGVDEYGSGREDAVWADGEDNQYFYVWTTEICTVTRQGEELDGPYTVPSSSSIQPTSPQVHPTDPTLQPFLTGALRESKEGKGKPHLVLAGFPRALAALSRHVDCELGRERNWEKGLPESSLIDSQFRHLMGYVSGVSEDSPEYNLTANVWNAMVLLEEYLRVQDGEMSEEVLDVEKESQ